MVRIKEIVNFITEHSMDRFANVMYPMKFRMVKKQLLPCMDSGRSC
jgi:hypothetical protein